MDEQNNLTIFKTVAEFSSDWLMWLSKNHTIEYISPAVKTITGYDRKEFIENASFLKTIIHPQDREKILMDFTNELTNPHTCAIEFRIIHKDGSTRWISHRCQPLLNDRNEVIGRISSNRNITERKQTEFDLKENKKFLKSVFDGIQDPMHVIDKDFRILLANKVLLDLKGLTQEEIRGAYCYEVYQNRHTKCEDCAAQKAFISGRPEMLIKNLSLPEGGEKFFEVFAFPLQDENGGIGQAIEVTRDITDLETAKRNLAKMARIVEQSTEAVAIMDLEFKIEYINSAFENITGFSLDEIQSHSHKFPAVTKEQPELYAEIIEKISAGQVWHGQYADKRKNKETYHVECTVFPIKDDKGKIVNYAIIIKDISEYKKAEKTLLESKERYEKSSKLYRLMADNIPDMVWAKDIEGKYLFANKALCEKLLIAENTDEPIGKDDLFFTNRQHRLYPERNDWHTFGELCRDSDAIVLKNKKAERFAEYGNVQGKFLYLDVYKAPIREEDGRIIGTVGHGRIVTKEKEIEKRLIESEEKFRRLFEESQDCIYFCDENGNFLDINPAGLRLFGYNSVEEMQQINFFQHVYKFPEDHAKFLKQIESEGHVENYELTLKKKDRTEIIVLVSSTALYDDDHSIVGFRGIMRDITEKTKLEAQLMQAQKMESIGTLAGGIAHDFNNLLTVINGYAEMALLNTRGNDALHQDILTILNAGKRAEKLTSQLLAFSRKQICKPEPLDINDVISSIDTMLRRLIDEDIDIETILESGLPSIRADISQLEQIFVNLVVNARDALRAIKEPGFQKKITIETGQAYLNSDDAVGFPDCNAGRHVFFAVSDNGIGMDEETKEKIFEPFFTTKEKYKGTGLGLSTIYGIVKQNNGFIYVYSERNAGTMFKIYWPVSQEKHKPFEPLIVENPMYGNETILVVEDEVDVRRFATVSLRSRGYTVYNAENGKVALELIQTIHPDIIISDLVMPELNGKEFVEKAKQIHPDVKVIFVSGYTDNHIVHNGILEPGVNFIPKPYSLRTLTATVRHVLDAD